MAPKTIKQQAVLKKPATKQQAVLKKPSIPDLPQRSSDLALPDWMRVSVDGQWTRSSDVALLLTPPRQTPEGHRWIMNPERGQWILQKRVEDGEQDTMEEEPGPM